MADAQTAFTPIKVGPITLRNRFIKAGANEGMTPHGMPTKALVKNHRDFAAGGVGMTTVAYGSVSVEGLTFAHQFCVTKEAVPHLKVLTDAVHSEGAAASLQITHAGAFTQIRLHKGWTPGSASGGFNKSGMLSGIFSQHAMTEAEMDKVAAEFVEAAKLGYESGFDAVEIHMGHGYLLNQFLSPLDNKRNDAYGGDAARRAKFPAMVLQRVKDAVGNKMAITAKINVFDGAKGGATGEDAAVLARALQNAGADLLTLSGGRNVEAPWALFGSPMPIKDLKARSHGFVQWFGFFMVGLLQPNNIKFHEMYFLDHSRKVRAATTMPLSFIGGVKSMDSIDKAMREGFDCISLARTLIHDPQFINKLKAGTITKSGCTSCNRCVANIYAPGGTECVLGSPNDPALNQVLAAS